MRRVQDHRHVGMRGRDPAGGLESVHPPHADVHQHTSGRRLSAIVTAASPLAALSDHGDLAVAGEDHLHALPDRRVIVDHHAAHLSAGSFSMSFGLMSGAHVGRHLVVARGKRMERASRTIASMSNARRTALMSLAAALAPCSRQARGGPGDRQPGHPRGGRALGARRGGGGAHPVCGGRRRATTGRSPPVWSWQGPAPGRTVRGAVVVCRSALDRHRGRQPAAVGEPRRRSHLVRIRTDGRRAGGRRGADDGVAARGTARPERGAASPTPTTSPRTSPAPWRC